MLKYGCNINIYNIYCERVKVNICHWCLFSVTTMILTSTCNLFVIICSFPSLYFMLIIFPLVSFHLLDFLPLHTLLFQSTTHGTSSSDSNLSEQRRKSGSRPANDKSADGVGVSATEKRFAYSLLEKLLGYFDNASTNLMETRPSSRFSRRGSYSTATEDVKFFAKVI